MNRKLISYLVMLLLTASLFVMPAAAETHTHNDTTNWIPITERCLANNNYILTAGNYCLSENISLSRTLIASGTTITLCLNGYTLSLNNENGSILRIRNNTTLTITDCKTAGTIDGRYPSFNRPKEQTGGAIIIEKTGTLIFENGTITNCCAINGGAIYNSGTYIQNGGTITKCSANNGGAIYNEGTARIISGTITSCGSSGAKDTGTTRLTHALKGGAIYNCGKLEINGGEITSCDADKGGAVYHTGYEQNSLLISGGHIHDCFADYLLGDGIFIEGNAMFTGGHTENDITQRKGTLHITGNAEIADINIYPRATIETDAQWTGKDKENYTFNGWYLVKTEYNSLYKLGGENGKWKYTEDSRDIITIRPCWTYTPSAKITPTPTPTPAKTEKPTQIPTPEQGTDNSEPLQNDTTAKSPAPLLPVIFGITALTILCRRKKE